MSFREHKAFTVLGYSREYPISLPRYKGIKFQILR
jgi:hypothetical protein